MSLCGRMGQCSSFFYEIAAEERLRTETGLTCGCINEHTVTTMTTWSCKDPRADLGCSLLLQILLIPMPKCSLPLLLARGVVEVFHYHMTSSCRIAVGLKPIRPETHEASKPRAQILNRCSPEHISIMSEQQLERHLLRGLTPANRTLLVAIWSVADSSQGGGASKSVTSETKSVLSRTSSNPDGSLLPIRFTTTVGKADTWMLEGHKAAQII